MKATKKPIKASPQAPTQKTTHTKHAMIPLFIAAVGLLAFMGYSVTQAAPFKEPTQLPPLGQPNFATSEGGGPTVAGSLASVLNVNANAASFLGDVIIGNSALGVNGGRLILANLCFGSPTSPDCRGDWDNIAGTLQAVTNAGRFTTHGLVIDQDGDETTAIGGMAMFGSVLDAALQLSPGPRLQTVDGRVQNLLYGNVHPTTTVGNLLLLQKGFVDKFVVDHNGNTTAAGSINSQSGTKTGNYLIGGVNVMNGALTGDLLNINGVNPAGSFANLIINGLIGLGGAPTAGNRLTVAGDTRMNGNAVVTGNTKIDGTLSAGATTVNGDLEVKGDMSAVKGTFSGDVKVNGNATSRFCIGTDCITSWTAPSTVRIGNLTLDQVLQNGNQTNRLLHLTNNGNVNVLQVDGYSWFRNRVTIGDGQSLCFGDDSNPNRTCQTTALPSCSYGEVPKWSGSKWICGQDNDNAVVCEAGATCPTYTSSSPSSSSIAGLSDVLSIGNDAQGKNILGVNILSASTLYADKLDATELCIGGVCKGEWPTQGTYTGGVPTLQEVLSVNNVSDQNIFVNNVDTSGLVLANSMTSLSDGTYELTDWSQVNSSNRTLAYAIRTGGYSPIPRTSTPQDFCELINIDYSCVSAVHYDDYNGTGYSFSSKGGIRPGGWAFEKDCSEPLSNFGGSGESDDLAVITCTPFLPFINSVGEIYTKSINYNGSQFFE